MFLIKELQVNGYGTHDFGDINLNEKFDLYNDNLIGEPNRKAIENFAAVNYFNALLESYVFTYEYTKEGFVATYYRRGKFFGTMVVNDNVDELRKYFISALDPILPDDALDILKDTNISLFEAAMRINYMLNHDEILHKRIDIQKSMLTSSTKENCQETNDAIQLFKADTSKTMLSDFIEPTYLNNHDFASKELSKHSNVLLSSIPSVEVNDEMYKSINEVCKDSTNEILNRITSDAASSFVEWGYTVICDTFEDNIDESDIYESYLNYQHYFLPENNKGLIRK